MRIHLNIYLYLSCTRDSWTSVWFRIRSHRSVGRSVGCCVVCQGRGHCVIFKTSAATDFVGRERDPHEFLDYILLDVSCSNATRRQTIAMLALYVVVRAKYRFFYTWCVFEAIGGISGQSFPAACLLECRKHRPSGGGGTRQTAPAFPRCFQSSHA